MNRIFKRITAAVTAFAVAASVVVFDVPGQMNVAAVGNLAVDFYRLDDDGKLTIKSDYGMTKWVEKSAGYAANVKTVEIQNPVTSIPAQAFRNCTNLLSVEMKEGSKVQTIGDNAFNRCKALSEITIPAAVTSIGSSAFENCSGLSSITIPAAVASIGSSAFGGCDSLTEINVAADNSKYSSANGVLLDKTQTKLIFCPRGKQGSYEIPSTVNSIEQSAFEKCRKLTSVTVAEGSQLTTINDYAFQYCPALESITIPEGVTSLGIKAFNGCQKLQNITIPASLTSMSIDENNGSPFMNCDLLTAINVVAANTAYSSADGVLFDRGKTKLICCPGGKQDSYEIPNTVTSVETWAFYACKKLASVTIPNTVTSIEAEAFSYCLALTSVIIPDTVTSIGNDAFNQCTKLSEIIYKNDLNVSSASIPQKTTQVQYEVNNDKLKVTGIALGTGKASVTITDAMGISFVEESLRSNVSQEGHTHIYKDLSGVATDACVICNKAAVKHIHGICGDPTCTEHEKITDWTPISDASGFSNLETGKHYYLTADVTLTDQVEIASNVDVTLCLNGNTVTAASGKRIFEVIGSLTLCDCIGSGKLTGGAATTGQILDVRGGAVRLSDPSAAFTMNGGTISENTATDGGGVYVVKGKFTMNGGTISDNTSTDAGGGVVVGGRDAAFEMNDGTISNNKTDGPGGGVSCSYDSTFILSGGTISNNQAAGVSGGGGVCNSGTFTMSGGTISGNKASADGSPDKKCIGGGVAHSSGKFTMSGGEISGNTASGNGGGVYCNAPFEMTGGTISNNTTNENGGGIYIYKYATTVTLGGKVVVTGNKKSDDTANNVYLVNGSKLLTIGESFSNASKIGVTAEKAPTGCSTGIVAVTSSYTTDISGSFTADADGQVVVYKSSKVQLALPHAYSTEWSSDGTNHWHACTDCGDKTDVTAHSGGTVTCQTQAVCTACKQEYGQFAAHKLSHHAAVSATCTKNGNEEYWECSACGKMFSDASGTTEIDAPVIIPAGHSYSNEWEVNETQHWHECTVCHDKKDTAAHSFVQKKDDTNHWQECSVCGYKKDETAHTWGSWELTEKPTLKTTGEAERTCGCGEKDTKSDVPALTDPIWTKGNRTDPTPNGTGSEDYTSTDYGKVTITIPALSDKRVWTNTSHRDATEEADGEDVYESTDYGTVTVILPALNHTHEWGDWEITKSPTLNEEGTAKRVCTKDDTHIDTKTLPVLTDNTVWTKDSGSRKDPTLKDKGSEDYTSDYGKVTLTIPELSDETVWTKTSHKDATEEADGEDVYESTDYGTVTVILPALDHTHEWSDWEITKAPTMNDEGTAKRVCTKNDTHIDTKTLPVLTDTTVWTKADDKHVDPTEDNDGKDVYTSEYGEVIVVLPALGHTHVWGDWEITKAPTLNDEGTAKRVCTKNDTHIDTKTLPVLTDTSVWTKVDDKHVDPTEDNDGKDVYTSEYGEVTVVLPALGHTHEWSGEWSKDDTYHWHDCLKNCGEKKDNAAHIWDGGTVTKQPTAGDEGEKTFECTVCGKTKTEILPPKDEPSEPDSGNISVDVQPEGNAPDTELKTPFDELADAVLTPEEQESIENGADIKIILIVSDATESIPADDKAKAEAAIRELSDHKLGQYLDLNLLKIIGDSEGVKITQTNKPITVAFEIPEELRGKAEYSVIRVHGGETEVLPDLDNDSDTVTIETDKFSTYVLVYKEKNTPSNPGGDNTSGENPGFSPNPPTPAPDESDNSDDTTSDDDNPPRDDSSDTTSSESKPTDEDNSDAASSGGGNALSSDGGNTTSSDGGNTTSSDDGNTTASESDTSSKVNDHSPSESSPSEDNGNPSTGIAVSLIPLVTAVAVLTAASKRKRNK